MKNILRIFTRGITSPNTHYYWRLKRLRDDATFRESIPLNVLADQYPSTDPNDVTAFDDPLATLPMETLATLPVVKVSEVS